MTLSPLSRPRFLHMHRMACSHTSLLFPSNHFTQQCQSNASLFHLRAFLLPVIDRIDKIDPTRVIGLSGAGQRRPGSSHRLNGPLILD